MSQINGKELREAFSSATLCLEEFRDAINALNVFPVPDGDTGTNMLLTMRSAMEKCFPDCEDSVTVVASNLADGAFWGARGNSGVILSQFIKGFARALEGESVCGSVELVRALEQATEAAYKSVGKPVEGTMLTVIRSAALAARTRMSENGGGDPRVVWEAGFKAARETLDLTPTMLSVLKEAGVVDAGGMGIVALLGGALRQLTGNVEHLANMPDGSAHAAELSGGPLQLPHGDYLTTSQETEWGYCIQFVVEGQSLSPEHALENFDQLAHSAAVVGDERFIRVHVHSADPGPALSYGVSLGTLARVKIENMDEQNQEFVSGRHANDSGAALAVVAVAAGHGLTQLFIETGCSSVINGGQTMNPSVQDILQIASTIGAEALVVLPNNGNVVPAAQQAATANPSIHVVPSRSIPQGVAALLAFNPEQSLEQNLETMNEAISSVSSIDVTKAVRDTEISGVSVASGQFIGVLEGNLCVCGGSSEDVLLGALAKAGLNSDSVVTLYLGGEATFEEAESVSRRLSEDTPGIQVDIVDGGQPHYHYLASVE